MMRPILLALVVGVGFVPVQERMVSIVLLIDVSASVSDAMAKLDITRQHDGTLAGVKAPSSPRDLFLDALDRGFIARLSPTDRMRIGRIASGVQMGGEFASDPSVLRQALRDALDVPNQARYGPSPLWDAVHAGVTALEGEPGRRAIVLITDGLSIGNRRSLQSVIDHANRSEVSVSIVGEWFGAPRALRFSFRGGVGSSDSTGSAWRDMRWPFGNAPYTNLERLAASTSGLFVSDGAPACYDAWTRGNWCGSVTQQTAGDCGVTRPGATAKPLGTGVVGGARRTLPGNPNSQCAGEDPTPEAALARIIDHLRRP